MCLDVSQNKIGRVAVSVVQSSSLFQMKFCFFTDNTHYFFEITLAARYIHHLFSIISNVLAAMDFKEFAAKEYPFVVYRNNIFPFCVGKALPSIFVILNKRRFAGLSGILVVLENIRCLTVTRGISRKDGLITQLHCRIHRADCHFNELGSITLSIICLGVFAKYSHKSIRSLDESSLSVPYTPRLCPS